MTMTEEKKQDLKHAAYVMAYVALFLVSIAAMTTYFSTDFFRPIVTEVKEGLGFSTATVNFLSSVYSLPAVIFLFFSGVLTDKIGIRKSSIMLMALIACGAYMVTHGTYTTILIGRLMIGLGAESFFVVMNKIVTKWFKDKQLAMAFGLNLLLCRLGSIAAFNLLPWIVKSTSLKTAMWIGAGAAILGFFLIFLYCMIDKKGDREGLVAAVIDDGEEPFKLMDALRLPKAFWAITLLCVTYYSTIFPFTGVAKDFFVSHHGMDKVAAGRLPSVILIISMCVTWAFGLMIDKIGKRATLMIIGSIAMIPCHVLMAFTPIPPIIPIIILGFSFALVPAALWPAVPLIVKEKNLGTAYAIIFMIQNIGLFAFEPLAGWLYDKTGNYKLSMVMFAVLGIFGLLFAIWLKIIEKKGGGYLDTRKAKVL